MTHDLVDVFIDESFHDEKGSRVLRGHGTKGAAVGSSDIKAGVSEDMPVE